ncbi:BTB/POZ domain-containing protein 6-like [Bacillus rossius redtenbacheri]|uniref:BTB/POZ domain-containing protein 6-like n=1 Tax=Bacillus rossius redtenbacheri TaxID=93214 RepID=UPI002FDECB6B
MFTPKSEKQAESDPSREAVLRKLRALHDERSADASVSKRARKDPYSQSSVTDTQCKFLVGDKKVTFKEDKIFLSSMSPVFWQMFNGSLKERGPVHIPDIDPDTFTIMLRFLHEGKCHFKSKGQAALAMNAAEKYMLPELKRKCARFLQPEHSEDLWVALECGTLYNVDNLTLAALQVISEKTDVILKHPMFLGISKASLLAVVKSKSLCDTSEIQLFEATLAWAKAQCEKQGLQCDGHNLRQQLGEVLQHIRFLVMDSEEFNEVRQSGVLTLEEMEEYEDYTRSRGTDRPKRLCPVAKPRKKAEEQRGCSFIRIIFATRPYFLHNSGKINVLRERFSIANTIYLKSVIVSSQEINGANRGRSYLEDIRVRVNRSEGKYRGQVAYGREICIPLSEPVELEEMKCYNFYTLFGARGYYPCYTARVCSSCVLKSDEPGVIIGFEYSIADEELLDVSALHHVSF